MSIASRLSKIENELKKSKGINGKVYIRFTNSDGSYPEEEEDRQDNNIVIKVMSEGISSEELRLWSE